MNEELRSNPDWTLVLAIIPFATVYGVIVYEILRFILRILLG